jgi:hypothetical protein
MALTTRGSRQAANPDLTQPPNQHQSDQTAQTTREKRRQYNRKYYVLHREHRLGYFHQHRTQRAANRRERYNKNPTPFLSATRTWVLKHRDRRRLSQRNWYARHKERLRTKRQALYQDTREDEMAKSKAYYYQHHAAVRARHKRYYYRKKAERLAAVRGEL